MKKIKILMITSLSILVCGSVSTVFSAKADNKIQNAGKKEMKVNPAYAKYKNVEIVIKGEKIKKNITKAGILKSDVYVHNFSDCPVTIAVVDSLGLQDTFQVGAHNDYHRENAAYIGNATIYTTSYICKQKYSTVSHKFKPYEVYHFRVTN